MYRYIKFLALFYVLLVNSAQINGQTPIDLGCFNTSDGTIDLDRKNWDTGSTAQHSEGVFLNFDLPSNSFGDCMKITEVTLSISVNSFDISNIPAGCNVDFYLNTFIADDLPFDPASISTAFVAVLPEQFDTDLFNLSDDYTVTCSNLDIPFDGQVGVDIIVRHLTGCADPQTILTDGFVTMDYDICVTGIVDAADNAEVNAISNDTEFCVGEDLALAENGIGNTDWAWEGPNGFSSTISNPIYTLGSTLDFGDYIITVTDADGCTNSQTIQIDAAPLPDVNITAVNQTICIGQEIELGEDAGDAISWSWSGPDGFTSFDQNPPSFTSSAASLGVYIVAVENSDGCTNVGTIVIDQGPSPDVMADAVSLEVCPGQNIELLETGGTAVDWQWDGPSGFSSTEQNPTITASTTANLGLYTVVITDALGCINSSSVNIIAGANIDIDVTAASIQVCPGQTIELQEIGGNGTTWNWDGPDGFTSTDNNPMITNSTADNLGTYSVTVTNADGCSNIGTVEINPSTPPDVFAGVLDPNICIGQNIELSEDAGDADTWLWSGPNSFSSTDAFPVVPTFDGSDFGTYTVTVTDGNGCTSSNSILVNPVLSPEICFAGAGNMCQDGCSDVDLNINITPFSTTLDVELEFEGTSIPNFTLIGVNDGQSIGICSDQSATTVDFDGTNLILPTQSVPTGTTITIQIASLVSQDNPACVIPINPICLFNVEYISCGCSISDAGLIGPFCDENGTPSDDSDDFITFTFDPQVSGGGTEYTVLPSSGTVVPNIGTYGNPTSFQLQDGSAGSGNLPIAIIDNNDPTCSIDFLLLDPGSCSGSCNITSAIISGEDCNDFGTTDDITDDFIFFDLEVLGTNTSATYTVTSSFGVETGTYGTLETFAFPAGSAGAGDVVLTIADSNDDTCVIEITLEDPGSCSDACVILPLVPVSVVCVNNTTDSDDTDDYILFEINPQGSNLTGDYSLSSPDIPPTSQGTFGEVTGFTTFDGTAGQGDILFTLTSLDDPTCTITFLLTDPGTCSNDCPDPGNCDDGDCSNGEEIWNGATCECESLNPPDPSSCVDDGDCSNGIEEWDAVSCTCISVPVIFGCTDASANNFNPAATCDDGTCDFDCPDPGTCDDGDCSNGEEVWNTTNCECESINPPDPSTCVDDGDCSNGVEIWNTTICECESVDPPDPSSCVDDGDCTNGIDTWNPQTCECENIMQVLGCTNNTANNYDPNATCDDGSCVFDCPDPGDCDDGDCSNGEEVWNGSICECESINVPDPTSCVDDGDCSNGTEEWNDQTCECESVNPPDPNSCIDDGDCTNGIETWNTMTCECDAVMQVLGCTNATAINYDPNATCDDGSCVFDCPDPGDCDDGDCSNGEEVWNGSICECESINPPDPSSCVDDGDCSNGEEVWSTSECDCVSINFVDPDTCVDDGDCTNGIEMWDEDNCECLSEDVPNCDTGDLIEMTCDDGDPCTENDVVYMIECSDEICVPCQGVMVDCEAEENIMSVPCDDDNPLTFNDQEIILLCDDSVCIPCAGELKEPTIYYPQIFTPNDDGDNDIFTIFSDVEFNIEEFSIYDRWGELMYSRSNVMSSDPDLQWNGRFGNEQVAPGVYVYYLKLGAPFDKVEVGDITLVY